jgi:hypothetical protein
LGETDDRLGGGFVAAREQGQHDPSRARGSAAAGEQILNVCFHGFLWVVFDVSRLLNWDKLAQEEVTALWNWEFMKTDVKLDTTPAQPFSTTTEMFMAKLFSIGKTCLSIKFVGMTITDEP